MGILNLRELDDPKDSPKKTELIGLKSLYDKCVCITGKIPGYTRKSFSDKLCRSNCFVYPNVVKNLDYLIVGEGAQNNSKVKYAQRYKIPLISYKDLM